MNAYPLLFWLAVCVWLVTVAALVHSFRLLDWYRTAWLSQLARNRGPSSISELVERGR